MEGRRGGWGFGGSIGYCRGVASYQFLQKQLLATCIAWKGYGVQSGELEQVLALAGSVVLLKPCGSILRREGLVEELVSTVAFCSDVSVVRVED